jgi:hypothetical protein
MIYFLILIIGINCFVIVSLIANFKRNKRNFQKRLLLLEDIVCELESQLELQNQKIILTDELKLKLKASNEILNNSIFKFNFEMLESIFPKK